MIINRKYKTILDVSLRHDYFFDKDQNNLKPGLCRDFNISTSPETKKRLADLGINLKVENAGFKLVASGERLDVINNYKEPIHIELRYKNHQLVYYTHLPGIDFGENFNRKKVLFFTNRPAQNDRFVFRPNAYASSSDIADKIIGLLDLPIALQRKNIKKAIFVLQKDSMQFLELIFQEPIIGEAIPLNNLPNGIYRRVQYFDEDGNELAEINFPKQGLLINNSPNLIGVIEIYLDRIGKKEQSIFFEKKEAFWNYIIKAKSNVNVDLTYATPDEVNTKLVYGEDPIEFEEKNISDLEVPFQDFINQLGDAFLTDSEKFTFFRSKKELPISEILNMGFSLLKRGSQEVIEEALTNPNPSNVLKIKQDAKPHHLYTLIDISNLDNN